MKFRFHKGSLENSMKTICEVIDLNDLKNIIEKNENWLERPIGTLTCNHYCYDYRIDWDTWVVCNDGSAIGFSNGELK